MKLGINLFYAQANVEIFTQYVRQKRHLCTADESFWQICAISIMYNSKVKSCVLK